MGLLLRSFNGLDVLRSRVHCAESGASCVLLFCLVLVLFQWYSVGKKPNTTVPFVDTRLKGEYTFAGAKRRFVQDGGEILRSNLKKHSVFYTTTDKGPRLILSGEYADEIRKQDEVFSHVKSLEADWLTRLPGFEPSTNGKAHGAFVKDMVMKLVRAMPTLAQPMSEEVGVALVAHFGDKQEWLEVPLSATMVQIISQTSTRAFIGKELCRNAEWIACSTAFAQDTFIAAQSLHQWPRLLHGLMHRLLPPVRKLRWRMRQCQNLLEPILSLRRQQQKGQDNGRNNHNAHAPSGYEFNLLDLILSSGEDGGEVHDPVIAQLALSLAAIHSTADLLGKVILDLARNPHMLEPLRQEIIAVIGERGLQLSAVTDLKLLDSVLKETQRMNPVTIVPMRRISTQETILADGTRIAKGTPIAVAHNRMMDADVYPEPERWDGYRFYNGQGAGAEHGRALVALSADHLGFGYGKHACPGRFFAAVETKIVLCHLLLRYDWALVDHSLPDVVTFGSFPIVNPNVKIAVRRRNSEIRL
ncbi:cytochrome P450 [Aspergillus heterothallicus]